jgi:hypothetical protein
MIAANTVSSKDTANAGIHRELFPASTSIATADWLGGAELSSDIQSEDAPISAVQSEVAPASSVPVAVAVSDERSMLKAGQP